MIKRIKALACGGELAAAVVGTGLEVDSVKGYERDWVSWRDKDERT